ncbi:MAG: hypothetical protein OJF60_001292 [Burkholderiaceae bacterium]|jgi:hypothetical protein|nr:MAG: hypothetical protein OJF60_001292 [Burkholderiaceae bacterium]
MKWATSHYGTMVCSYVIDSDPQYFMAPHFTRGA